LHWLGFNFEAASTSCILYAENTVLKGKAGFKFGKTGKKKKKQKKQKPITSAYLAASLISHCCVSFDCI
jgi:hypothetical protein